MNRFLCLIFPILLLQLAACAKAPTRRAEAEALARTHQMTPEILAAGPFDLLLFSREGTKSDQAIIYIEGDGMGWVNKNRLSNDPTPASHTLLELALNDPRPGVFYLARPCQYVGGVGARNCSTDLWDASRYSERVVASMDQALDQIKQRSGATQIALVGHSGGGVIALLLAARRPDVNWVVSVASPLDIDAFTKLHNISPIDQSLNPTRFAAKLSHLPQIHYFGENDEGVPASIGRAYMNVLPDRDCAKLFVEPGADHNDGWRENWPDIIKTLPACGSEVK
jgi:hypothetical protein